MHFFTAKYFDKDIFCFHSDPRNCFRGSATLDCNHHWLTPELSINVRGGVPPVFPPGGGSVADPTFFVFDPYPTYFSIKIGDEILKI